MAPIPYVGVVVVLNRDSFVEKDLARDSVRGIGGGSVGRLMS